MPETHSISFRFKPNLAKEDCSNVFYEIRTKFHTVDISGINPVEGTPCEGEYSFGRLEKSTANEIFAFLETQESVIITS